MDLKLIILILVTTISFMGGGLMLRENLIKDKLNHKILSIYLYCISIIFASTTALYFFGYESKNLFVILLSYLFFPAILSIAPLIYLYIQSFTFNEKGTSIFEENIWHFAIPIILFIINIFSYITLSQLRANSENFMILDNTIKYINFIALFLIFLVQNIFYIYLSVKIYSEHKEEYQLDRYENILTLKWIKYFLFSYAIIFVALYLFQLSLLNEAKLIFRILFIIYIISMIYFGSKNYSPLLSKSIDNYLDEEQKNTLGQSIIKAMEEDKIFLNPKLNLQSFAKSINTNTKYLSKYINQEFNQNLSTLINEYRIKEAQKLLKDPANDIYTMESLAGMTGYSSKSSFNNAFKKITGMTPSEYKNS